MTTSLEKYDKKQLAVLRVDRLISAVDGTVRALFNEMDEASDAYNDLRAASAGYKGGDPDVEKVFRAELFKARRKTLAAVKKVNDYVEEQRSMFGAHGMDPDRAYTHAIVPVGPAEGSDKERFRIVKRGLALEVNDTSDDNDRSVLMTMRLPSEKFNVNLDMKRGKYNDGSFLIAQATCGLDRSEINGEG